MVKKIISFSLNESTIEKIEYYSSALGMSRSEFIEWLILEYMNPEITIMVNEIRVLQEKLYRKMVVSDFNVSK